jgi:predicted O-methyltransferase YrrM
MIRQFKSTYKAIKEIVNKPKLLNKILDDNSVWMNYVKSNHAKFINGFPVVEITDLIPNFNEKLETVDFLGGGSTPPDLAIIKALCKTKPACKYFEIGTWRGESAVNASEVCEECYTMNLDPIESFNGKYKDIFGFFSNGKKNITQVYGDSTKYDFGALNKKFDVVFIDADHHYSFIKNDTEKVFKHLIKDNSIVIWHDYGVNPATPRYETMAAILDAIPVQNHKYLYHVSNSLCAIYSTELNVPTYTLTDPAIPTKKFRVTLEAVKI